MLKLVGTSFRGEKTYIYIVLKYLSQNTNYKRINVGKPSRYHLKQVIEVNITSDKSISCSLDMVIKYYIYNVCERKETREEANMVKC